MANYNCNNCDKKFKGEDFILECPLCRSSNISEKPASEGGTIIDIIKNNRRLAIIIGLIITVIILFSLKNCRTEIEEPLTKLSIKTNNKDNFIEITIIDLTKKVKFLFDQNPKLFSEAGFMAIQNGEKIAVIEGKIYPCSSGFIKLTWKTGFGKITAKDKMISSFEIKTLVNKRANCREKLTLSVKPSECFCELEVLSNYDNIDPTEPIMISINGRNGRYLDQKRWRLNEINSKYEVWGYIKGRDTIQASPGMGRIMACSQFDADQYFRIAKQYAENPGNLNTFNRFKSVTKRSFLIKYEGEVMNLNDLSNRLRTEWKNNGTTFKVNITWNSAGGCGGNNKTVRSINFYN
jgi:hypothetical protein|tara:strand:+ start:2417 stop:3466 length:1050 start_codon:yes stop_codon:yes gene_type:complete